MAKRSQLGIFLYQDQPGLNSNSVFIQPLAIDRETTAVSTRYFAYSPPRDRAPSRAILAHSLQSTLPSHTGADLRVTFTDIHHIYPNSGYHRRWTPCSLERREEQIRQSKNIHSGVFAVARMAWLLGSSIPNSRLEEHG
jgi:hypothetical protein